MGAGEERGGRQVDGRGGPDEHVRPAGTSRRGVARSLVGAAAWVAATVVAGAVAWSAVVTVGGARDREGVLGAGELSALLAEERAAASTQDSAPSPDPSVEPSVGPSELPPTVPPPPVAETAAPDPAPVVRTWDVAGGQVSASCLDGRISLLYATPFGGWAVEVDRAGPDELEVELRSGDRRVRVRAVCVDGIPEQRGDGGDGTTDDEDGDDGGGDRDDEG